MPTATGILSEAAQGFLGASHQMEPCERGRSDATCDVEDAVVGGEGTVLPALPFPVNHDLHHFGSQRDAGGVDGHAGGRAVACLVVLA